MKSTVESSIQAMVEKTQAQYTPPTTLPDPTPLQSTSHHSSSLQHQPPRQRTPRRSLRRSRSHHHGSPPRRPDKRPVSTRRSPRRRRSSRRHRRSSRNRSHSRSHSHHRHDSPRRECESSITFRSASPQRRDDRQPLEEYHQPPDYSSNMPTLQASSWWKNQNPKGDTDHPEQFSGAKWQSWGTWKNYSKNPSSKYQATWKDPMQSSNRHDPYHDPTTKPLTAFSTSKSTTTRHNKKKPDHSGDDQSQFSESIPSGHMLISLRDGSRAEWIRGVKFGLNHPDRMKAASEVPLDEQPKPTKTVNIEEFQRAVNSLQRVDSHIP